MRRKDREMSAEFGYDVIDRARYATVAMVDSSGLPYALPISVVRKGKALYVHSAKGGKKTDVWQDGITVTATFVCDVVIPHHISNEALDEALIDRARFAGLVSQVFTTQFASAIVMGRLVEVKDEDEYREALRALCLKYIPERIAYADAAIDASRSRTAVYRIDIQDISAKRKRYDKEGKEMKWQRME